MKTAVRKLEVRDVEELHALVIENAESLEQGLTVLDYRLLLGHATIDAVARDAGGSLVLMAIGFTADEEMLLKAVEAYSWCLEYPDAIRRLYPGVELSEARPPRLVFVIERMPDSFHRKMKQLGFPDVDCVEFRLLDVNGAPAVYFERLARLRRTSISDAGTRPAAPSASATEPVTENVVALGPSQRAATSRLQKLLTQANVELDAARPVNGTSAVASAPAPVRDIAPVVSMISRASVAPVTEPVVAAPIIAEPVVEQVAEPVRTEPVATVEVEPVLELASAAESKPAPVVEPVPVSDAATTLELVTQPAPAASEPVVEPTVVVAEPVLAEPKAAPVIVAAPAPVRAPESIAAPKPEPVAFRQVVAVAEPKPAPAAAPEPKRVSFAEAAAKALLQQTRPAPAAEEINRVAVEQTAPTPRQDAAPAEPKLEAAAKPAPPVPGFEGLQFPGDGQLTRQWMEFLNQMAAAKK